MNLRKSYFCANLKSTFISYTFLLSIIGAYILCYISTKEYLNDNVSVIYILDLMINLSLFKKGIVFFSALSCAACFVKNYNSGMLKFIIIRSNVNKYIISDVFTCSLAGFSCIFIAILSYAITLMTKMPLLSEGMNLSPYENVAALSPMLYICIIISIFSLSSSMWSIQGLAISAILPNTYIAIGSPLIFSYVLEELTRNFPPFLDIYRISHGWKVFGNTALSNYFYSIIFLLILILMEGFVFSYFVKRRIKDGQI